MGERKQQRKQLIYITRQNSFVNYKYKYTHIHERYHNSHLSELTPKFMNLPKIRQKENKWIKNGSSSSTTTELKLNEVKCIVTTKMPLTASCADSNCI